jgi:hypothetical protein
LPLLSTFTFRVYESFGTIRDLFIFVKVEGSGEVPSNAVDLSSNSLSENSNKKLITKMFDYFPQHPDQTRVIIGESKRTFHFNPIDFRVEM